MSASPIRGMRRHLPVSLRVAWFRRLLGVRLLGQFGDGLFQASLAGAVLFSPEQQPDARSIAAAFAVILLPYSVVGPLAGVLLDRWSRQRVLVWSNVVRAVLVIGVAAEVLAGVAGPVYYGSALVVISINRFLLAALSASLPHVVPAEELVSANAVSTTAGATSTAIGLGVGVGLAGVIAKTDAVYALVAVSALLPYLAAGFTGRKFGRHDLGPDLHEKQQRESAAEVLRGLVAGARHVADRPPARRALLMIGAQRFCFGIGFVCTLLLFRNYLTSEGPFRAGLAGLGQVIVAVAAGAFLAAVITPRATRRWGFVRWTAALLVGSAFTQIGLGLPYRAWTYVAGAFLLGFASQGIKICVDTIVQRTIEDDFRGRVFSLYDTLFNVTSVVAATVTAVVLPTDGHSPVMVIVLGVGYVLTAVVYVRQATSGRTLPSLHPELDPPDCALPDGPLPERAVPERALPERALPERAVPERAVPERVGPSTTRPGPAVGH